MLPTERRTAGEEAPFPGAETRLASPERDQAQAIRARMTPYSFMAPAGLMVILFFFIPMLLIIYLSVTNLATTNFTTNVLEMEGTYSGLKPEA